MKALTKCFALVLMSTFLIVTPRAQARLEVSGSVSISGEADFYAPLTPHGGWVEIDTYGRCWQPSGIAVEWRPYCSGEWVWTDHGWYWESDEPWAWACYHYGRWVYHPRHHWVWVPGVEWAPAWVTWRVGGGYVGWAPLPPSHLRVSLSLPGPQFVFVQSGHFHGRIRPSSVIVNNTTIINKTKVVSKEPSRSTRVVDGKKREVFINNGPKLDQIEKGFADKVKPVSIQQAAARTPVPDKVKENRGNSDRPEPTKAPDKRDTPDYKPERSKPSPAESPKPDHKVTPGRENPSPDKYKPGKSPKPSSPDKRSPGKPSKPGKPGKPGKGPR